METTLCTCSLRRVVVFNAIIKALGDSHGRRSAGGLGRDVRLNRCTVCMRVRWADRGRAEPRSEGIVCVYVYVIFLCVCVCMCVYLITAVA